MKGCIGYMVATMVVIGAVAVGLYYTDSIASIARFTPDNNGHMFLSTNDMIRFLKNDADRYVASLTAADLAARGVSTQSGYLDLAVAAAAQFDGTEKARLLQAAAAADARLLRVCGIPGFDGVKAALLPWSFAKMVGRTYEGGLPHTRMDVIFLPSEAVRSKDDAGLIDLLIHEKVHIYERACPDDMFQFLQANKYIQWKPRSMEPLIRANPDVDPYIYINPVTKNEMAAYYTSAEPSSVSDVEPLDFADEHPYEWLAYQIVAKR